MNKQQDIRRLPIPEFPGYYADETGNIFSEWVATSGGSKRVPNKMKLLKPKLAHGYLALQLKQGHTIKTRYVHQLILLTFEGPCPADMECCHNDGDRTNNTLSNLRYDTRKANAQDRQRHGTVARGTKINTNILTPDDVRGIRLSLEIGESEHAIAKSYGISRAVVNSIRHHRIWGWLD